MFEIAFSLHSITFFNTCGRSCSCQTDFLFFLSCNWLYLLTAQTQIPKKDYLYFQNTLIGHLAIVSDIKQ